MWVFTVLKSLVVGGGGVMVEERRGEARRECRWCVGGRANMVYLSLFVSEGFLGCPLPPPSPPTHHGAKWVYCPLLPGDALK